MKSLIVCSYVTHQDLYEHKSKEQALKHWIICEADTDNTQSASLRELQLHKIILLRGKTNVIAWFPSSHSNEI